MDEAKGELEDLIARALAGSQALDDAILRQKPWLMAKIHASFRRHPYIKAEPEDFFQETFLQARNSFTGFSPRGDNALVPLFCRWLGNILRNLIVTHLRKIERDLLRLEQDSLSAETDSGPSPSRATGQRQAFESLNSFVSKLEEPHRRIVLLHYFEHKTLTEIAESLEITKSAVAGYLYRARQWLREQLGSSSLYHLPPKPPVPGPPHVEG